MKNIKKYSLFSFLIALLLVGCSTDFLEEKRDLTGVTVGIYEDEVLANWYLNYIYFSIYPDKDKDLTAYSVAADEHDAAELFARTTDEKAGEDDLNRPYSSIAFNQDHCLRSIGAKITTSSSVNNSWTRIRYCNQYLNNVDDYTGLSDTFKNGIKGQMYYFRALQYFELVRLYGGVPLILEDQAPEIDDPNNQTPRSTSGEVFNQIASDLDMAVSLLPTDWTGNDYGRVTRLSAAALKGRALLTWASPLFNRNDDVSRWQRAYDACKAAYDACTAAGKGLHPDWKNMWFEEEGNIEAITVVGYNNHDDSDRKNNANERKARSREAGGDGSISPTKNAMDIFPMSDGTEYNTGGNLNHFYRNRDPRFYYTFSYNGAIWPWDQEPNWKNWTYWWHDVAGGDPEHSTESGTNETGIYLRKFTNDNFVFSEDQRFRYSGADYIEFRFAEVVLNLAEAAVGIDNLSEAKGYLEDIRARAGVLNNDGSYGLSSVSSRDEHFAACINERRIELAYENKRFWDLRRWMLYNDNFGTCTRLNQTPIHGIRRQGYYTIAKTDAATEYVGNDDPFKDGGSGAPIIDRDAESGDWPLGVTTYEEYVDYLYDNHFDVIVKDDVDDDGFIFTWYDEYYFFGFYEDVLESAPYLRQTKGWGNGFGAGVFDPLAE